MLKHGIEHVTGRIFPSIVVGTVAIGNLFLTMKLKHTIVNYWVILLLTSECKTSAHTCR